MIRLLASEWLRTKRTAVRWLTFGMPVIFALCATAYVAVHPGSTEQFVFEGFFTIWTVIIIPIGVGVLSGFIVQEEELAGNFIGVLGSGVSRTRVYLGKFLLLFFCLTACTFTAVMILCIGMNTAGPSGASVGLFLAAGALAAVGTLPMLAVHLWVSFVWGMGASIGISMGGLLMAALFGITSLGEKFWPFVPWAWPVKLGMLPGVYYLKESGTIKASEITSRLVQTGMTVSAAAAAGLCIFLIGGILWFHRWEGRKSYE